MKINGIERIFFKGSLENEDVDELPFWLYPLQKSKDKPFDINFQEGDRTQKLGAYLFYLVSKKKYTAEQTFKIVQLMNEYVFDNPIPESTLKAEILNDSTLNKLQEQQKEKDITHSGIAKEIIDYFGLITVNSSFYCYENGVNVLNGILDFADDGTVTLLPHSKEYISFRQFNVAYNPELNSK